MTPTAADNDLFRPMNALLELEYVDGDCVSFISADADRRDVSVGMSRADWVKLGAPLRITIAVEGTP